MPEWTDTDFKIKRELYKIFILADITGAGFVSSWKSTLKEESVLSNLQRLSNKLEEQNPHRIDALNPFGKKKS